MTRKLARQLCDVESIAVGGMETVAKQSAAAEPEEETARAKAVAAELKEQANQAGKTQACSGTLQLTLKGADLPDTDGFFNKSDPFFKSLELTGTLHFVSLTCRCYYFWCLRFHWCHAWYRAS